LETATLRRRFKEVCAATDNRHQTFQIRVYRALSWYERATELDEAMQPEGRHRYARGHVDGTQMPAGYGQLADEPRQPMATLSSQKSLVGSYHGIVALHALAPLSMKEVG
jgi:hypothetical protein